MEQGLHRVAEVLFGCVVGIAVSWLMSRIWPLPETTHPKEKKVDTASNP
jgi:hypothetical protein